MNEINNLIRFICILSVMTLQYAFVIGRASEARTAAGQAYTMQVCSQAHQVNDGKSEKACGDAQDKYKLEFLCSQQGACWTEVK